VIEVFCVDRGGAGAFQLMGSYGWGGRISIGELQGLFWLRDLGHGGLGEAAPALQLPFLLLRQQLAAHQPGDRGVVGENADHVCPSLDHQVKALQRVDAPDCAPLLLCEVQECQHVFSGGFHPGHSVGRLLVYQLGDRLPLGGNLIRGWMSDVN